MAEPVADSEARNCRSTRTPQGSFCSQPNSTCCSTPRPCRSTSPHTAQEAAGALQPVQVAAVSSHQAEREAAVALEASAEGAWGLMKPQLAHLRISAACR